ncbi:MAG TPA: S-methyl-5-thioribose-1-phosphate isomerase [Thermoanaerobaculaceae bacterium]|nr:S-methyl-5-thioribose-1-phosphate isomerase [Thermoanaerobaculaceae bacterium]
MRTVSWNDGRVVLVDQTRLPERLELIETDDVERVALAIRRLEVRGAPAIGVAAAYGLALAAFRSPAICAEGVLADLETARELLAATRPTAANLFWALDGMMAFARRRIEAGTEGFPEAMVAEAERMADRDVEVNRRLAEVGAELIPDGARVLTHCNCGPLCAVDVGTAMAPVIHAHGQGKRLHVYTDETRPRLQGAKLNAWELARAGVPYTVITDSTGGWLMSRGMVDLVMIGVDRVAANGDTAAKIGVYSLAVLARHHAVPFYAVSPLSTVDTALASGAEIPIEERDPDEVRKVNGTLVTMPDAPVLNYAFDVTPGELITAIVTERGIARPPYCEALRALASG